MDKILKTSELKSKRSLVLILLAPLLIDVLIGLSLMYEINFPIGKLYRGALYLIGVIVVIRSKQITFFVNFLIVWCFFFIFWLLYSQNFSASREISFLFKATYLFPVLQLTKSVNLELSNKVAYLFIILKRYAQIIASLVIFSFFTGIGIQTYGQWVFGTSSFFVAQNDIGLSHLLVFTFLIFNKEIVKISWFWLLLIFLSLLFLGTSTGMFGALAVVVLYVLFKLVLSSIKSIRNFTFRIVAIGGLFVLFTISTITLINYIKTSDYYSRKYESILNDGFRSRLKDPADTYFVNRGIVKNMFGEGFSSYTTNLGNTAPEIKLSKGDYKDWLLVETDPYDFFGSFGIILACLFFSYYVYCFLLAILNYYNNRNIYNLSLLLIFSMAAFHGIMAGHVFYSPTVLGILTIIVFLIQAEYYKKVW